jgi:hypothetical protein
MSEYLTIRTESGDIVMVEADNGDGRIVVGRGGPDAETLEGRLDGLRQVLASAARTLSDIPRTPDKLTIEVGAKFVAGAGVVIAKTSAEASIKVVAEWHGDRIAPVADASTPEPQQPEATPES